eukprot:scaffold3146_cov158-Amphora_coffeaeformis.AAC.2
MTTTADPPSPQFKSSWFHGGVPLMALMVVVGFAAQTYISSVDGAWGVGTNALLDNHKHNNDNKVVVLKNNPIRDSDTETLTDAPPLLTKRQKKARHRLLQAERKKRTEKALAASTTFEVIAEKRSEKKEKTLAIKCVPLEGEPDLSKNVGKNKKKSKKKGKKAMEKNVKNPSKEETKKARATVDTATGTNTNTTATTTLVNEGVEHLRRRTPEEETYHVVSSTKVTTENVFTMLEDKERRLATTFVASADAVDREGGERMSFTITRFGDHDDVVAVNWKWINGTAGVNANDPVNGDFTPRPDLTPGVTPFVFGGELYGNFIFFPGVTNVTIFVDTAPNGSGMNLEYILQLVGASSLIIPGQPEVPIDPDNVGADGTANYTGTILPTTPSQQPSMMPSESVMPSDNPSGSPSATPSAAPTPGPTPSPSTSPSEAPTESASPSAAPSFSPSESPSGTPSTRPSAQPTISTSPSESPSGEPSAIPSASSQPSESPSSRPSDAPSDSPSASPSESPSGAPSAAPSASPSASPSVAPSASPSATPSASPS